VKISHGVSLLILLLLSGCGGEATIVGVPSSSDNTASSTTPASDDAPDIASANPAVEPQTSDNQTTAAELEDSTPVTTSERQYTAADVTDLVLITGQSNALGAETDFDASLDSPHDRVFAFTDQGWQRADLHQVWDRGWFPRGHPGSDPSNNFALHIGKGIANRRDNRVFGFILVTAPGMGINHWDAEGHFFAQINTQVHAAINQMPHKSNIDGIFWHQGESDEGDQGYGQKLDQLIERFRIQSWFSHAKPFICGETAKFSVVNQQLMALNHNGDRWTACVGSQGLDTREDGIHFNAQGLRQLGDRYAAKYLQVTD